MPGLRLICSAPLLLLAMLTPATAVALPAPIANCDTETALRAAVDSGGEWAFQCSPGNHTIALSDPLEVTSSVSLDATGQSLSITGGDGRVFEVVSGNLELVGVKLSAFHVGAGGTPGGNGTGGVDGSQGADLPCIPENDGAKAENGQDGGAPLDDATTGGGGGSVLGGAMHIAAGATVSIHGGQINGQAIAGGGGRGGEGGRGGSGGRGGNPAGAFSCGRGIFGGDGGLGQDGADGANGGDGGDAKGGAIYVSPGATLNVTDATFFGAAHSGSGGRGGHGGEGGRMGRFGFGGSPCCNGNDGAYSGTGGDGGDAGDAGDAQGGAIYNAGTLNVTRSTFAGTTASSRPGGEGGRGGEGGNGHGETTPPVGSGGDGGNGGDGGETAGGAIYSTGTLNVYSGVFENVRAGWGPSSLWNDGGVGGEGGHSPLSLNLTIGAAAAISGDGGNGGDGGSVSGASIAGPLAYSGCAEFVGSKLGAGKAGPGGKAGIATWESIPGTAGTAGTAGSTGMVDPPGFAPYPCDSPPSVEGPPGSPSCSDGVDNDGDSYVDANDPGCQEASTQLGAPSDQGTGSPQGSGDDRKAPDAKVNVKPVQKAANVALNVSCPDEACVATASSSVNLPKRASASKRHALKPVTKSIPKGGSATLKLKLPKQLRASVRRALNAGRKVTVKIGVVVADAAGNRRASGYRVKLKL